LETAACYYQWGEEDKPKTPVMELLSPPGFGISATPALPLVTPSSTNAINHIGFCERDPRSGEINVRQAANVREQIEAFQKNFSKFLKFPGKTY